MQVVPNSEPFIGGSPGDYCIELNIALPPLIPGFYNVDFWIGLHDTETFDFIRDAVTVEVIEGPDPTRTYRLEHGSIAPTSSAKVTKFSIEPQPAPESNRSKLRIN